MAEFWYNTAKMRLIKGSTGEIDIINDTIVIMALMTDSEEADNEFVVDIIGNGGAEVDSTGYVGGFEGADRLTIGSLAITVDEANDRAEIDCADITWPAIARAAAEEWVAFLVAKEITSDAASPLIAHLEPTGVPLTPNGSDIKITIDEQGLLQIT